MTLYVIKCDIKYDIKYVAPPKDNSDFLQSYLCSRKILQYSLLIKPCLALFLHICFPKWQRNYTGHGLKIQAFSHSEQKLEIRLRLPRP